MKLFNRFSICIIIILFFKITDSEGNENKNIIPVSIKDVSISKWKKLAQKKIYFGHRSVGNNIMDGIKDLMKKNQQIRLNIVKPDDQTNNNTGFFMHSMINQNASPQSISEGYQKLIEPIGENIDIVLLRFTPFYGKKEMNEILADYKGAFKKLQKKYPGTIIVHNSFPLNQSRTTWKTWIKKIIGEKEIWEYDQNIIVNEFNMLLRDEYDGKEPFFDLAKFQSTFADGRRSTFTKEGKKYFHTVPAYTYDGTHLNEKGRKMIAKQLLLLLISII